MKELIKYFEKLRKVSGGRFHSIDLHVTQHEDGTSKISISYYIDSVGLTNKNDSYKEGLKEITKMMNNSK